jgi:integrase
MLKKKLSSSLALEREVLNRFSAAKCLEEPPELQDSDELVGQRKGTTDDASGPETAMQSGGADIPIVEFCDKVMKYLIKECRHNKTKEESELRRIATFLTQNPSVNTTADLTSTVIGEFAATCEGLNPSFRLKMIERLRVFCDLAIEWGYLNRHSLEGDPLPKVKPLEEPVEKSKLGADEIARLMAYLEARKDTWAGHRFYALTATVLHAGLKTGEAMKLTLSDCDLVRGVIRVPGRAESGRSKSPPEVRITPPLDQILSEWIPVLSRGNVRRGGHRPYGSKRAEDGRAYIPDEAEQKVLSDMLRWRAEGMSDSKITRELNSRGIPTKHGKKGWNRASVTMILNRVGRPDYHDVESASESGGRKEGRNEGDSSLLFPIIEYRTTHSARERRDRGGIRVELLREACKALGIKVTLASLRRFYFDHARRIPDQGRDDRARRIPDQGEDDRERGTVRVGKRRQRPPSVATWPPGRCPVTIKADEIVLIDEMENSLTYPQMMVVKALVDAGPSGLSGDELIARSGRLGYRNILKTLAKDENWRLRIRLAGLPHGRYRLAKPDDE